MQSCIRRWTDARTSARVWFVALACVALTSCATTTTQGRWVFLDQSCPAQPKDAPVDVFRKGHPERPFIKVSRLDVHLESTHFVVPSFESALPELERQARESGANAVIDLDERWWKVGETRAYHITATGIRYID